MIIQLVIGVVDSEFIFNHASASHDRFSLARNRLLLILGLYRSL